ncbi:MAG: hypothetical protein GC154_15615 [bacterium]|nr:hypothetical protein [bacterium]
MDEQKKETMTATLEGRRSFLKIVGGAAAATGIAATGLSPEKASAQADPTAPAWPWTCAELDPNMAAEMGYTAYSQGGCCYGAFKGLVGQLAETQGYPFTLIPLDMMRYGAGGVVSWGSLCGTLNGAAAAINLVLPSSTANPLIDELMAWYSTTALPIYVPDGKETTTTSVSNSPLCHASVSKWCEASNLGVTSNERKERCARLVADVASKAAELINAQIQNAFVPENGPAAVIATCNTCHGSTGQNNVLSKMDCNSCHEPEDHPLPISGWQGM